MAIVSRVVKPKSKRAKRALEKREPKVAFVVVVVVVFVLLLFTYMMLCHYVEWHDMQNLPLLMARVR